VGVAEEMTIERLARRLGDVDLLRTLDHGVLCDLAERVLVAGHDPDSVVLSEGEEGDGLYLVLQGTAIIERSGVPLATLGPGEHVGELALLDGGPRSATVRAGHDLLTAFLPSADFVEVLDEHPTVALELLVTLAGRFRRVQERLVGLERGLD
jgi:CRP-like cAMP-binding protein